MFQWSQTFLKASQEQKLYIHSDSFKNPKLFVGFKGIQNKSDCNWQLIYVKKRRKKIKVFDSTTVNHIK